MKASEYKKLTQAKQKSELLNVELPSGAVFICRRPPVQQWILAGRLPENLASKLTDAAKESADSALKELKPDELMKALMFGRDLIVHSVIEPKIALEPKTENEIAPEDILPEDFEFLLNWVMSGGEAAKSLEPFRPERLGDSPSGIHSESVQSATVEISEAAG